MPTPKLSRELAEQAVRMVEECYRDGFKPKGRTGGGPAAIEEAGRRLKVSSGTIYSRIRNAKLYFDLAPDESLWADPANVDIDATSRSALALEHQKAADTIQALQTELRMVRREHISRGLIREWIRGITEDPIDPPRWLVEPKEVKGSLGTAFLFASDWHWGARINPSEIGGCNAYSLQIAHLRARHFVETAIHLLCDHLAGAQYDGLVLPLGGDMLSGDIHDELTRTNEVPSGPALLDITRTLAGIIALLADKFGKVFIPCVTGNHTRDPRDKRTPSKERAATNFDWILYQMLALHFEKDERISWAIAEGNEVTWDVYEHRFLLTHGDDWKGGDGIIGPLGPLTRGRVRRTAKYASMKSAVDMVLVGHYHSYHAGLHMIANGSLMGIDEYVWGKDVAIDPPTQACWVTHPDRIQTFVSPIYCNHPNERDEWHDSRTARLIETPYRGAVR